MNLLKNKLPALKHKKISIKQNDDINLENLKLTIFNTQRNHLNKTPLKLKKAISFSKSEKKVDTSSLNKIENKNFENNLIRELLYQKIKINKYLRPIRLLQKSNSSVNINNIKYNFLFNENNENDNTNYKKSNTFLLFNKFNGKFGNNLNIKKITNINRYLIKNNENDTNGNFIYNDYDEEKKESITFIIKNNNSKEFYKKRLTKNNQDAFTNNKLLDDFKFYGKRFDSPAIKNIKKIKYIQAILQQKSKDINIKNEKSEKKICVNYGNYDYILREKLKGIENQIDSTGRNLLRMDNMIKSCLVGSRIQFENDIKSLFGKAYLYENYD